MTHPYQKVKVESEKVGLKLNIQKTKIMASGSITSWEIDGETVKTVSDFILGGSKIIANGDCSHEIKRRLLLGRKVMTNLNSISKSRDITLQPKVRPSSQSYGSYSSHVWQVVGKVDPQKRVLCLAQVFLRCRTAFANGV